MAVVVLPLLVGISSGGCRSCGINVEVGRLHGQIEVQTEVEGEGEGSCQDRG